MLLQVKTLSGYIYGLDVEESDTIYNVMVKIEDMGGPEIEKQKIIWAGKYLDPHKTCEFYNINDDDTVHLVIKENKEKLVKIINKDTQEQWDMTIDLEKDLEDIYYLKSRKKF